MARELPTWAQAEMNHLWRCTRESASSLSRLARFLRGEDEQETLFVNRFIPCNLC